MRSSDLGAPKNSSIKSSPQAKDQKIVQLQRKLDKCIAENQQLKLQISGKIGASRSQKGNSIDESIELQMEQLSKEKANLEESLRSEMLASEEQRNYINILKEAIETKIEDLGLAELLARIKGRDKRDICDIFSELTAMKKDIDEKRKEVAQNKGDVEEMRTLIVDLKRENEDQKEQLLNLNENYEKVKREKDEIAQQAHEFSEKVKIAIYFY